MHSEKTKLIDKIFLYVSMILDQINCIAVYKETKEGVSVPKSLINGLYTLEIEDKELLVKKENGVKNSR